MEKQKTNIVHQWNIKSISKAEQYKEEYNHCDLCGGELIFSHVTNFIQGDVEEQAQCLSCKIDLKKVLHKLQ